MATVLQLVVLDETGDTCYRMRWPAMELARQDPSLTVINMDARARERGEWAEKADLLVIYQSHDLELLPVIATRRARGLPTLVEYNDNFYEPPVASPVAREWSSPLLWQIYELFMREADGILVTGEGLASLLSSKVDTPVFVLKNHLPAPPPTLRPPPSEGEPFLLGWAGSLGHASDLLYVVPLLRTLVAQHPLLHLCLMGNEAFPEFIGVPSGRLSFTPWGSMEQYFEFWRHPHCGVVPLLPTPYNVCRSDIKALEIVGGGALPLLPNLTPYEDLLRKTKLPSWSSLADLESLILLYMRDRARYERDRQRAYQFLVQHRIGAHRRERLDLYKSFLKQDKQGKGGYREMVLPPSEEGYSKTLALLNQAQTQLREGDAAKALSTIEALYPSPDVLLLRLRALHKLHAPLQDLLSHITLAERLYPRDLRFSLFVFEHRLDLEEMMRRLQRFVNLLRGESQNYQRFFQRAVCDAASQLLESLPIERRGEVEEMLHALISLYPNALNLRYALALHYEVRGEIERAVDHLSAVVAGVEALEANQRFLQQVDKNPLLCSYESLSGVLRERRRAH